MTNTRKTSVLIIDDHPLFRKGVAQLIEEMGTDLVLAGEAQSGSEGIKLCLEREPDLVLLDLNMKGMGGIETLIELRKAEVDAHIVVLTVSNAEEDLVAALRHGANGYLLKDMEPEVLLSKIKSTIHGQVILDQNLADKLANSLKHDQITPAPSIENSSLTKREFEILTLLAEGMSNKLIARELDISNGTVKVHMKNLLRKINVHSRLEAAIWALNHNIKRDTSLVND